MREHKIKGPTTWWSSSIGHQRAIRWTPSVRSWHFNDIEAVRSHVRFRAPFGRQCEGAHIENMSTFEADEGSEANKGAVLRECSGYARGIASA